MSSAVSARPPGGQHREPELSSAKAQQQAGALGLTSATGLVIGTVIGAGVFTMPAVLAGAGTVSLAVLAVIAAGAMVLAVLFGQLTRRVPNADGGLYAYARHEFGDFAGYLTGWCYWVQAWAGNAAIVATWVFYVDALFGISPSGLGNWGIALIGLWIPAAVNLAGLRQTAWLQNLTVVLKFLPLLFVAVVGWFFVSKANFGAFNASGGSLYSAIGIAAGVALFSFIGVETAAITAKRVKDPRRNVGRASLLGTGAAAVVYLAASAAVMGLVSHHALVDNGAPFVNAFETIFPQGALGREAGRRAGRDLRIRRAHRLDPGHRRGVARAGQRRPVPAAVRLDGPQGQRLVRHRGRGAAAVAADAVALHLKLRADGVHRAGRPDRGHRGHPVPVLGLRPAHLPGGPPAAGAGLAAGQGPARSPARRRCSRCGSPSPPAYSAVYQAMVVVLAGIILYAFIRARRERLGQVPAPADLAPATVTTARAAARVAVAGADAENPEGQS